jgi:iron complex outermembrane recepter protein
MVSSTSLPRVPQETKGGTVSAGGGSSQTGAYEVEYGGSLGSKAAYRAFGRDSSVASRKLPQGMSGHDGWSAESGGFRMDWDATGADSFMFEGNAFTMDAGQSIIGTNSQPGAMARNPIDDNGLNLVSRWTHRSSDHSQTTLQIYGSGYNRNDTGIREKLRTLDIDFQHHIQIGGRNDVVWGAGYRRNEDQIIVGADVFDHLGYFARFHPVSKGYALYNTFVQDELSLTPSLSLTLGAKLEHNAFSGFQTQPSARLAWLLRDSQTLWASASQAVRQPSRLETALSVDVNPVQAGNLLIGSDISGNPRLHAERLRSYEAGYRVQPLAQLSFDLAAFYGFYRDLQNVVMDAPKFSLTQTAPLIVFPFAYTNAMKAENGGLELAADWKPFSRWKLTGNYSWLAVHLNPRPSNLDVSSLPPTAAQLVAQLSRSGVLAQAQSFVSDFSLGGGGTQVSVPADQVGLNSYFQLTRNVSIDNGYNYVGAIRARNVPAYNRVDVHLCWKLTKSLEASLAGQNLLSPRHPEFASVAGQLLTTEVPRSIFATMTWSFR